MAGQRKQRPSRSMTDTKHPSLEGRIVALHDDIDALIARHVDAEAAEAPGVPKDVIRQMLVARAHGFCRCRAAKLLQEQAQQDAPAA
jgi:hypothetical protein